jgi:hypothetical protein
MEKAELSEATRNVVGFVVTLVIAWTWALIILL